MKSILWPLTVAYLCIGGIAVHAHVFEQNPTNAPMTSSNLELRFGVANEADGEIGPRLGSRERPGAADTLQLAQKPGGPGPGPKKPVPGPGPSSNRDVDIDVDRNVNVRIVNRPSGWRGRHWGGVVFGITLGALIVVAANTPPPPPDDSLCWTWTNEEHTEGFWYYCDGD